MREQVLGVFAALLLVMSPPAEAALKIDLLIQLVESGRSPEAYDYAKPHELANEGDPVFDFWFGLAAINSGYANEGVFALERVLLAEPNNDRARLELARGYFLLEEDLRARQEFETVLRHNPPDKVRANIKVYLDRIRVREASYRSTARAYVEFATGYDTNINSAPADPSFSTPVFGTLTLVGGSVSEGEHFTELQVGGQLTHPFDEGNNLTFGFNASTTKHTDSDEFEPDELNGFVSVTVRDEQDTWKVSGQLQEYEVDSRDNRALFGLVGEWSRRLNKSQRVSIAGQVAQLAYPDQHIRDSTLYTLAGSVTQVLSDDALVFAAGFVGHEDAHSSTQAARSVADREFIGARAGGVWRLNNIVSFNGSLFYQYSDYAAESLLFGETREDDMFIASAGARLLLSDKWTMKLDIEYTDNESTLFINEYDRTLYRAAVRYDF